MSIVLILLNSVLVFLLSKGIKKMILLKGKKRSLTSGSSMIRIFLSLLLSLIFFFIWGFLNLRASIIIVLSESYNQFIDILFSFTSNMVLMGGIILIVLKIWNYKRLESTTAGTSPSTSSSTTNL